METIFEKDTVTEVVRTIKMQRMYRPRRFNQREPVEDLREKLNRKRQEQITTSEVGSSKPPPPDPAYNFLRDPLRGDEIVSPVPEKKLGKKNETSKSEGELEHRGGEECSNFKRTETNSPGDCNRRRGPPRGGHRQNWRSQATAQDEQRPRNFKDAPRSPKLQPVNIKVEVSSASGERKCTLDVTKTVQIPPVTQKSAAKSHFRKQPSRESQKYYVNKNRQKSSSTNEKSKSTEITGKKLESQVSDRNDNDMVTNASTKELSGDKIKTIETHQKEDELIALKMNNLKLSQKNTEQTENSNNERNTSLTAEAHEEKASSEE